MANQVAGDLYTQTLGWSPARQWTDETSWGSGVVGARELARFGIETANDAPRACIRPRVALLLLHPPSASTNICGRIVAFCSCYMVCVFMI